MYSLQCLVGSVLLIVLALCVVFCVLFVFVLCLVPNVASVCGLPIIVYLFGFL